MAAYLFRVYTSGMDPEGPPRLYRQNSPSFAEALLALQSELPEVVYCERVDDAPSGILSALADIASTRL